MPVVQPDEIDLFLSMLEGLVAKTDAQKAFLDQVIQQCKFAKRFNQTVTLIARQGQ